MRTCLACSLSTDSLFCPTCGGVTHEDTTLLTESTTAPEPVVAQVAAVPSQRTAPPTALDVQPIPSHAVANTWPAVPPKPTTLPKPAAAALPTAGPRPAPPKPSSVPGTSVARPQVSATTPPAPTTPGGRWSALPQRTKVIAGALAYTLAAGVTITGGALAYQHLHTGAADDAIIAAPSTAATPDPGNTPEDTTATDAAQSPSATPTRTPAPASDLLEPLGEVHMTGYTQGAYEWFALSGEPTVPRMLSSMDCLPEGDTDAHRALGPKCPTTTQSPVSLSMPDEYLVTSIGFVPGNPVNDALFNAEPRITRATIELLWPGNDPVLVEVEVTPARNTVWVDLDIPVPANEIKFWAEEFDGAGAQYVHGLQARGELLSTSEWVGGE